MKVLCIDAKPREYKCDPPLYEGCVYTVLKESPSKQGYILKEVKSRISTHGSYYKDRFIPISDIDETELAEQRELQTV